jgi:wyosine [tRNA(Phe)-imidazoG37] synthetase (radical SAM superfamily)
MKTIYGPVPSWRFGRSLGVDPICSREKICSFDCVYCQLGQTKNKTMERKEYVSLGQVVQELRETDKTTSDVITFSGTGEPTLNSRLGEMISSATRYGLPVVVLTNSSLMHLPQVREALCEADVVSAKLDAADEVTFNQINRPLKGITFDSAVDGLKTFRKEFKGKLALQMMFVSMNKASASEMAHLAREIGPDEIQLDTPLRRSAVPPLSPDEMAGIEAHFQGLPFIQVYSSKKPETVPFDIHETRIRRPGKKGD